MAIANAWQNSLTGDVAYASALKQGTGWNPIHAIRSGDGRNIAPDGTTNLVPQELTTDTFDQDWGYTDEDEYMFMDSTPESESRIEVGVADRPSWGVPPAGGANRASMPENYPSWGPVSYLNDSGVELPRGIPGGTVIRSEEKGAIASSNPNQVPDETVNQGWINKDSGPVADAVVSDPSQYEMQTSMTQRDKVRAGSQSSGTASEYEAPIKSRITGQKIKWWTPAGEPRHYDMAPKAQEQMIRPFWLRTAGTGDPSLMQANEFYVSTPYQRTPPLDPDQGEVLPLTQEPDGTTNYGFTSEDSVY